MNVFAVLLLVNWLLLAELTASTRSKVIHKHTALKGCGNKPFNARVVNGENASPHSLPWQISLRENGRHICGGSLIDRDWVVTAAHCVDRNPRPSAYTVVVGARRKTGSTSVQQKFHLKQLFKHEGFNRSHMRNDVALLQLERPISASSKVNTLCLPSTGSRVPVGSRCYIAGWGRTIGGGGAADTLQQAMLPVANHSAFSSVTDEKLVPVDEKSMLCADGQGKSGCQGDSGEPFVCNEGGRFVLRGSSYTDWINNKRSVAVAGAVINGAKLGSDVLIKMLEALSSIERKIAIGVENKSGFEWTALNTYFAYGTSDITMPYTVRTGEALLYSARKTKGIPFVGVKGVMTYYIEELDRTVAVLFNVPYNQFTYKNKWNIRCYQGEQFARKEIYKAMNGKAGFPFKGDNRWYKMNFVKCTGLKMKGSMNNSAAAMIEIHVELA